MPELVTRIKREAFHRMFTTVLSPPPEDHRYKTERECKYEFRAPPTQNDPVLRVIRQTLGQLSKDDIGVAAASIRVWNTTISPPIWPPILYGCKSKFYTFKEWYEEFPITVPVFVVSKPGLLTIDMLLVHFKGELRSLKSWLKDLPARKFLLSPPDHIPSQQKWWKKNGKTFKLFELPKELRIMSRCNC